jgi:hypothetical protein
VLLLLVDDDADSVSDEEPSSLGVVDRTSENAISSRISCAPAREGDARGEALAVARRVGVPGGEEDARSGEAAMIALLPLALSVIVVVVVGASIGGSGGGSCGSAGSGGTAAETAEAEADLTSADGVR